MKRGNLLHLDTFKMAMASNRKKGDYSVLSEVNTEEEWINLLERKVNAITND